MIRQILGRAVVSLIEPIQLQRKLKLMEQLSRVLCLIGPKKLDVGFVGSVGKIIDQAVHLTNQMAQEQALFECHIPKTGHFPTEEPNLRVADESQRGRVFMCTFPGFGRKIVDDGKTSIVWLVTAYAELQSAFRSE